MHPTDISAATRIGGRFFARSAIIMAAIVVLSFPLTYYLPIITGSRKFHILFHVHAAAFFAWFALYVWQTHLVAEGKIARHREIGLTGLVLSGAMIPLGFWVAQRAAETRAASGDITPYAFAWFNVIDIGLFAGFMLAAITLVTKHKEWHRRFVFVAALCLAAPAATRWTLKVPIPNDIALDLGAYLIFYPFLIALAVYDYQTRRRLHPATLVSFAILAPLHLSSPWISRSAWWNAIAPGLIGPP